MDDDLPYAMTLSPATEPIDEFVTKLGGNPVWLEAPQWPVCVRHDRPMAFIGQFRLPGREPRMAYLFMSEHCEGSWDPEAGENALIVQPGRLPPFIQILPGFTGPDGIRGDVHVDLDEVDPECLKPWESRIMGQPAWLQSEEYPPGAWSFFFQLNESDCDCANFGGGVGYGFLSADELEGRFLWQC